MNRSAMAGQFARFLLVGGANTILTFAVYEALLLFASYSVAFFLAFLVGLCFTAVLNIQAVFAVPMGWPVLLGFGAYYVGYFLLNWGFLAILIEQVRVPAAVAPVLVLLVMTPLNFLCSKQVIERMPRFGRSRPAK